MSTTERYLHARVDRSSLAEWIRFSRGAQVIAGVDE